MIANINVKNFFYGFLYCLNTRVAKLHNLTRIGKDYVVVLTVKIRFLVIRLVLSKLMFAHQTTFQQELNRVVEGRSTHPILFLFHIFIERLYVKMVVVFVNLLHNRIALRGLTVSVVFQIFGKHLFYNLQVLFGGVFFIFLSYIFHILNMFFNKGQKYYLFFRKQNTTIIFQSKHTSASLHSPS